MVGRTAQGLRRRAPGVRGPRGALRYLAGPPGRRGRTEAARDVAGEANVSYSGGAAGSWSGGFQVLSSRDGPGWSRTSRGGGELEVVGQQGGGAPDAGACVAVAEGALPVVGLGVGVAVGGPAVVLGVVAAAALAAEVPGGGVAVGPGGLVVGVAAAGGHAAAGSGAGLVAQLDELGQGLGGVVAGLGVLADADGFEQVEQPLAELLGQSAVALRIGVAGLGVLVGVEQLRWRQGPGVQVQRGAGGGVDHQPPQARGGHEQPGAVGGDGSEALDPAAAVVGVDQGADRDVHQDGARVPHPQVLQQGAEQQVRPWLRRRLGRRRGRLCGGLGLLTQQGQELAGQGGEHVGAALVARARDAVLGVPGGLGADELLEVQAPAPAGELVHGRADLRRPVLTGGDPHVALVAGALLAFPDQLGVEVDLDLQDRLAQQPPQVCRVARRQSVQDPAFDLGRDLVGAAAGQAQQQLHGRDVHRALLQQAQRPAQDLDEPAGVGQLGARAGLPDPRRTGQLQQHVITPGRGLLPPLDQDVPGTDPTGVQPGELGLRSADLRERRPLQVRQRVRGRDRLLPNGRPGRTRCACHV